MKRRLLIAAGASLVFVLGWAFFARESIQVWLDQKGIEDYATELGQQAVGPALQPRDVTHDLRKRAPVLADTPKVLPEKPPLDLGFTGEIWAFRSAVGEGALGQATFWVFRHGELGARPVVFWLPGNGFGPVAYPLVRGFYTRILDAGYDLAIWVPPYHVNRTTAEERGILTANTAQNLDVLFASVSEVRTMVAHLRGLGTPGFGGWGGSMGAAILWMVSSLEPFDFLSLMIPVIDWRTITVEPAPMQALTARISAAGTTATTLAQAYLSVSPIAYSTLTKPERIQIQLAQFDQLTPQEVILEFADQRKILTVQSYPRSHATILLTPELYEDFGAFLGRLKSTENDSPRPSNRSGKNAENRPE